MVAAMLPYFFITNRTNYARWTPAYILDMLNLSETVQSVFISGEFLIRQKPGALYSIWSDMATEKTIIKDSKACRGIIRLTRKKPALLRWMLTRHILAHFSSEMRSRSGLAPYAETEQEENRQTAMTRDKKNVSDLIGYMHSNMTDPFNVADQP
ncbi:unnamed protein product [Mytilus coruscus]|uniref:Uncharacterized protein n=1 Tax=Mytilus coruscus TaxID=42192 RepID=A0A6J8BY02_MYTCO|nr:unnamed protein product [Mytilus coruscus]